MHTSHTLQETNQINTKHFECYIQGQTLSHNIWKSVPNLSGTRPAGGNGSVISASTCSWTQRVGSPREWGKGPPNLKYNVCSNHHRPSLRTKNWEKKNLSGVYVAWAPHELGGGRVRIQWVVHPLVTSQGTPRSTGSMTRLSDCLIGLIGKYLYEENWYTECNTMINQVTMVCVHTLFFQIFPHPQVSLAFYWPKNR